MQVTVHQMLTRTSETAIRALIYLVLNAEGQPVSQRQIAREIDASPTYLAKTLHLLVKAGILQSQHGAHGGVVLAQRPAQITLRDIVEACQGILIGNYCAELENPEELADACSFHQAMHEIFQATVGVMENWTLEILAARPMPNLENIDPCQCKMAFGCNQTPMRAPKLPEEHNP